MTNSFLVAVFVLWSTNQMDTLLTPSGDDIRRSMITMRTDIYTLPGHATATNITAVATNSIRLLKSWIQVPDSPQEAATNNLPPVPTYVIPRIPNAPNLQ